MFCWIKGSDDKQLPIDGGLLDPLLSMFCWIKCSDQVASNYQRAGNLNPSPFQPSFQTRLLRSTENVNDFNELLKTSHRSGGNDVIFWRANEYEKAKSSISNDGDGLGKEFVKQFMPKGSAPSNDTLQNAIDSYYSDRRKKAADKREAIAKDNARIADEERQRLQAEAAI